MAPPPELIDNVTASLPPDLISEILLRLPPDEPEHLFRAALVCKSWLRAICEHGFLRRYRAFHGSPPLLGLLHRLKVMQGDPAARLARTTAVPLSPDPTFRRALDCRHGRALLHASDDDWYLIVWDPVTGERHRVPEPGIPWLIYSAAVFCAASGCDHLDCHGGPFRVVFIATDDDDELVKASVYSSETCAWNKPVILADGYQTWQERLQAITRGESYRTPYVQPRRGALVGDEIYFTLRNENAIIKYNWAANCLSKIDPPIRDVYDISLMEMENGSLGYACIQGSSLYVWSRNASSEGAAEWVQCWVIELEQMVPVANRGDEAFVVGSAEGVGVIFMSTGVGLFTIELKSRRVKKVEEPGVYSSVLPYMSFYTPGIRSASHAKLNSWIMFTSITTLQGRGSEENVLDKDGKYGL
uniref:F-box domain-containing protein n=1 Tax=Oryza glaberrima TaxID=4538 RepID=I1QHE2_ORYGL